MTEQYKLKQGDKVVMHTCMEHDHPDNFGKIWTCKTDSFRHKGHDYDSIFLEGFSGSFSTEYLQKVDMAETQQTIDNLSKFPRQANNEGGWTIDYKFLEALQKMTYTESEYDSSMEQIEVVLLSAERLRVLRGEEVES